MTDVEVVKAAMADAVAVWLRTPHDRREREDVLAQAAMRATLELAEKALRERRKEYSDDWFDGMESAADWLARRAKEVG